MKVLVILFTLISTLCQAQYDEMELDQDSLINLSNRKARKYILADINRRRAEVGAPPVKWSWGLSKGAQAWANLGVRKHNMFWYQYRKLLRGGDKNYDGAEILAFSVTHLSACDSWQKSYRHKLIMLGSNYKKVGIGLSKGMAVARFTD